MTNTPLLSNTPTNTSTNTATRTPTNTPTVAPTATAVPCDAYGYTVARLASYLAQLIQVITAMTAQQ